MKTFETFFNLEDSLTLFKHTFKHMSLMLGQATEPHLATAKFTYNTAYIGWNEFPRAYNFIHEGLLVVEVYIVDSKQS